MKFREYLTTSFFIVLLIWGPLPYSWPLSLVIRISYLIILPLLLWILLNWIWNSWQPSIKLESILIQIHSGIISISLFVIAYRYAISKTHLGNTQAIKTSDGIDVVGDDIILNGPDWSIVFFSGFMGIIIFLFGVLKLGENQSDSKNTF